MRQIYCILIVCICIVFIINMLLALNAYRVPSVVSGKATEGKPFYFVDSRQYWSEITDVLACGNYIYLLYGNKKTLACYDPDGNYLHSYAIKMIDNGEPVLYTKGGMLYVETKGHDWYWFQDGIYVDWASVDSEEAAKCKQYLQDWELTCGVDQKYKYEIRGSSIWKLDEENQVKIISRPAWLVMFQGSLYQLAIHGICLSALVFFYYKTRK